MQCAILSGGKCWGGKGGGWGLQSRKKKKRPGKKKKSIVVCINHGAARENYRNMS